MKKVTKKLRNKKRARMPILFILSIIAVLASAKTFPKAPVQEFEDYHKAFGEAYEARAYFFAEDLFSDAVNLGIKAYEKWQFENTHWILVRDYKELRRMVLLAMSAAEEAGEKARKLEEISTDSTTINYSSNKNKFLNESGL